MQVCTYIDVHCRTCEAKKTPKWLNLTKFGNFGAHLYSPSLNWLCQIKHVRLEVNPWCTFLCQRAPVGEKLPKNLDFNPIFNFSDCRTHNTCPMEPNSARKSGPWRFLSRQILQFFSSVRTVAAMGRKPQIWPNFEFYEAPFPTLRLLGPSLACRPIFVAYASSSISSGLVYCTALEGWKSPNVTIF